MSLDYRPDAPFSSDTFNSVSFLIPDKAGNYRTPYSATAVTNWSSAFSTAPLGARMVQFSDGTPNVFFGLTAALHEWNGSTLQTVTRAVGGAYATGSNRWWFCQYGDSTVASNYADATQVRTSSASGTLFAALANAPKAKFFLSQGGFLLACNYDDGSASPNGIKWPTQGSSTTWTPATGNTAGNALLRESPGQIVAGAEIHDIVVIWKKNSMYVGRVVGGAGTDVWRFNLLSPKIGCASQEAWVSTPVGIIFVSPNNGIYRFDGSVPVPIDRGFRQEFYRNIGTASAIQITHDEASQTVFIWTGTGSASYAYNYGCDKWGFAYTGPSLGNASFTTFGCSVRDANYDDYITLGGTAVNARRCHLIVTSEKKVCNLSSNTAGFGINATFSIPTLRDPKAAPDEQTQLNRVIPIFAFDTEEALFSGEPTSGTLTVAKRARIGAAAGATAPDISSLDSSARWDMHTVANTLSISAAFTGQKFILSELVYETQKAGAS